MSAAVCTHPIDLVKVRMQLAGVNQANAKLVGPIGQALEVIRTSGVGGLYKVRSKTPHLHRELIPGSRDYQLLSLDK